LAKLIIENIFKSFNGQEILKGINLACENGEFLVLVGPSGCGKSTLLNLLAGLESPTLGTIQIGDRLVNDVPPRDRNIAMVFQSYALYPNMTVRQNIGFSLEMRKVPRAEREKSISRVSKVLQLDQLLDRKPQQLSGGQRQRVAMGRALVRNPDIFLFDEPLSNLDAKLRVEMRTEIKKLHQTLGTTIVYVTHDQVEAMTLADRIAVLKDGLLQQLGTPQEIYDTPINTFVAGFIGSPSMNFIPAFLHCEPEGLYLDIPSDLDRVRIPLHNPNPQWKELAGKRILAGIRPESITGVRPSFQNSGHHHTFEAMVEVIEPTGPDTMVHFSMAGTAVTARVRPPEVKSAGGKMPFMVDMAKTLLFDPETSCRLN
jgi:multiple sugar transport system ATP-binding protein